MVLNWSELPIAWYGFDNFTYTLLMIAIVPGALAFILVGLLLNQELYFL